MLSSGAHLQLPPYHCYFNGTRSCSGPCWPLYFWSCFCSPPFHTPSPQPRPATSSTAEQGEDKCLPKSPSAPSNIFSPPWGSRTMNNSHICKFIKKDCSKSNLVFLWMKKNGSTISQINSKGEKQHTIFSMSQQHVTFACLPKLKCKGNKTGLLTIQQTLQPSPLDQHSFLCLLLAVELSALHQSS